MWWCFCVFVVVVFVFLCGGVVVCGDVFVVVWWCFCVFVVMFAFMVMFLWLCGAVFVFLW